MKHDPYASEEDTRALLRKDERTPAEKKLDRMLDERGAWEQGAEPFLILRQIALDLLAEQPAQQQDHDLLMREPSVIRDRLIQAGWTPPAQQPAQIDWEAVAADQAMTIALLKAELQEFVNKEADAVEVALTESGWVWDGDQWQRPPQTWAGLTDEEIKECFDSVPTQDCQNYEHWRSLCARNIEAKLKEKNT